MLIWKLSIGFAWVGAISSKGQYRFERLENDDLPMRRPGWIRARILPELDMLNADYIRYQGVLSCQRARMLVPSRIPRHVLRAYDAATLAKSGQQLLADMQQCLMLNAGTEIAKMDPTQFSSWLCSNIPASDTVKLQLLGLSNPLTRLQHAIALLRDFTTANIVCAGCGWLLELKDRLIVCEYDCWSWVSAVC